MQTILGTNILLAFWQEFDTIQGSLLSEWGGPYKITQGIIYAHSIEYVRDGLWWIRAPPHEAEQLLMFCQSFSLVL